jgi:uncharacterized membrane protein YeaQ/YmgE (transglycosylase-associated protein family)
MKFSAIKGLIGAVAPTIGAALGGPVGGAAAKVISQALGCKEDERSIEQAVQAASPEDLAKIREAELEFESKMAELKVDVFALEAQDKQDARKHFAKDWTAKFIGILMVLFFCAYIAMVTIMPPEQNSMELINLVLGYLGGLVSAVISFYFGASQKQD